MIQAIGGSMLNPVAMSIITNTFTDAKERAQAIGVWGAVVGVSMALGPVIGGLLVDSVGWRSIFWINIPIGLVGGGPGLPLHPRVPRPQGTPHRRGRAGAGHRPAGQPHLRHHRGARVAGWSSGMIIGAFAVALASLVGLLLCEPRRDEPLIDLRFFRSIPFSGATVIAVAAFAGLGGFLFLNTLYLQEVRGLSPLQAGIDTLPMAAMALVFPTISGRIVGTRGARIPLLIAGVGLLVSCLMLVRVSDATPFSWLFAAYVVFGIGFGFVNAPITNAAVSGMPRAQAGVASAIASTSRQIGATLGVAVVGALVTSKVGAVAGGVNIDFAVASRAGWWVLAGCGAVVLVLGMVVTSQRARASAQRTAEELNPEFLEGHRPMSRDRSAYPTQRRCRRRRTRPGTSCASSSWTTSGGAR